MKYLYHYRLRTIYAKRTGKREANMGAEENQSLFTPTSATKHKRKMGADSDDDDDDDDDSDDQAEDEDDEEEEEIKKVKKVETNDEVLMDPSLRISSKRTL